MRRNNNFNDDDIKIYEMGRSADKKFLNPKNNADKRLSKPRTPVDRDSLKMVFLYVEEDKELVREAREWLITRGVSVHDGIEALLENRNGSKKLVKRYDYVVVFCSDIFLKNDQMMSIMIENYNINKRHDGNPRIIPVIIDNELYKKSYSHHLKQEWEKKKEEYVREYDMSVSELDEESLSTLGEMDKICSALSNFVMFITKNDLQSQLSPAMKIGIRIKRDRGDILLERSEKPMNYVEKNYGQVFMGDVGTVKQEQNNYGLDQDEVRDLIEEVMVLIQELNQQEAKKLKSDLAELIESRDANSRGKKVMSCIKGITMVMKFASTIPELPDKLQRLQDFLLQVK